MSQYDMPPGHQTTHKDLGDLTANATVEWVLLKLSSTNNLAEVVEALPEDLCEALNTTRLIDLLRPRVKNRSASESIEERSAFEFIAFESIERIAEELEGGEWWRYPRLSVLLLSIAKEYLDKLSHEEVKKTNLYRAGERIYYHFMEQPDTYDRSDNYDRCVYVLKAGFQLFHYNKYDEEWCREFKKFQALYHEILVDLRVYYYFGDNFAELQAKAERGGTRIIESTSQSSGGVEDSDYELQHLSQEFKELNPQRLEFPFPGRSMEALKFASRFTQNLDLADGEGEKKVKEMAREFRILQWEILVRNLVEEDRDREFRFYRSTVNYNIPERPEENFLISLIDVARRAECHFIPPDEQIPMGESNGTKSLNRKISESYESFKCLKVPDFFREDYVHSFVNLRNEEPSLNVMWIRDGELSFFSLLWLLRYTTSKNEQAKNWKSTPEDKRRVGFRPSNDKPFDESWSKCDMYEFAEECGLIIRLRNSECLLTRRWRSLIEWLQNLNDDLKEKHDEDEATLEAAKEEKILSYNNSLLQRLPLKRLDYDKDVELSFITDLWKFLASDDLTNLLEELDFFSETLMSCEDFANKGLGPLLEYFDSLLKVESSAGLEDVLLHCCRGFIPLEHLLRAYQPYEIHLLVQALNWERSFLVGDKPAPISLGFAAIAGSVLTAFDQWLVSYRELFSLLVGSNSESSQDLPTALLSSSQNETAAFGRWLVPYRSLFSALSADFALPAVQDASKQIGKQDQQTEFVHQTMGLLDTVWVDPKRDQLDTQSHFALWLARNQVASVWGNLPIDTIRKIDKDFPLLSTSGKRQIVDKLVDFGLSGGIRRASRTPKNDSPDNLEWDLTAYGEALVRKPLENSISEVRRSLSFKLPEGNPPEWVDTTAFATCFYHAIRQAVYHALKTFVLIDNERVQKKNPCLWIKWGNQIVSIYNRGEANQKFKSNDRGFFNRFVEKTSEFCRKNGIDEIFQIDGPEPTDDPNIWRLVIRKEKASEF